MTIRRRTAAETQAETQKIHLAENIQLQDRDTTIPGNLLVL